ncbi:hypothetical protein CC1G_02665 [Coprinopsis cinerea okayama7|uniref:Transcription elongation factor n=1 Tax=Coprinopsis cinerea (strain Okayama-7 / 130 / ATCC MYA-4618 / FGSC 9003) TaxID=240176 RepID=A8PBK0_COPC7|nr:hypothetical protein CC1G_02665 [Coprinopsis cinerea okayama7\|eukprot:XP_001840202.1 hypothetical protein CC1G_02665 [Coprinopsis cinerea okayama7\
MSKDVVELKKNVKALSQAAGAKNEGDIISILKILKNEFDVTEQILRESKAGLAVGKLRSHDSKEISTLAKEIVRKWKTAVDKQKGGKTTSAASTPTNAAPKPAATGTGSSNNKAPTPTSAGPLRTAKSDGVTGRTGDKVRDKCVELLYDALASDSTAPIEMVLKRASEVEEAVFNLKGGANQEYRGKIRSLYVNLKDKNNPTLKEDIVSGEIPASRFAVMTSEEMASEEQKAALKKIHEENLFKSLAAQEADAETDAFQCSKCKQRKCRYRQAQTRSADEPMTTFVTCVVCGNRWKFS